MNKGWQVIRNVSNNIGEDLWYLVSPTLLIVAAFERQYREDAERIAFLLNKDDTVNPNDGGWAYTDRPASGRLD